MASGRKLANWTRTRRRLHWLRYGDCHCRGGITLLTSEMALVTIYTDKRLRRRVAAVQRKRLRREPAAPSLARDSARSKDLREGCRPVAVVDGGNDLTASYREGKGMHSGRSEGASAAVYSGKRERCPATVQGKVWTGGEVAQEPTASLLTGNSTCSPRSSFEEGRPMGVVGGNSFIASAPVGQCDSEDKVMPLSRSKRLQVASPSLLAQKLQGRMDAARFRWLNQLLYTSTGSRAADIFKDDPSLFSVYHRGYSEQVSQWPINPLDTVIEYIKGLPKNCVVADLGCGEGRLASCVHQRVHSFDLLSTKSHVTACDMAHLPLASESVDVAVFCLSLMGTNLGDYISEAWRVLQIGGRLKIVEVVSRIVNVAAFMKELERFSFVLLGQRQLSTMFVDLELKKIPRKNTDRANPHLTLKPCLYKRR